MPHSPPPHTLQVDALRAYFFGSKYMVEVEVLLPPDMSVRESHDIALALQHKVGQGRKGHEAVSIHQHARPICSLQQWQPFFVLLESGAAQQMRQAAMLRTCRGCLLHVRHPQVGGRMVIKAMQGKHQCSARPLLLGAHAL